MFAPRQVPAHLTLGQREIHGCVVTVLVTASVEHYYLCMGYVLFRMLRFLLNWSELKHFEFKYPSDLGVMLGNYSATSLDVSSVIY